MFQRFYDEIAQDTSQKIKSDEMRALRHSINLLQKARQSGPGSRDSVEAIFFLNRLWGVFLEDLASENNGLPGELRAQIISIGIWMLRHAEELRQGTKKDFQPLIDISENIYAGLRAGQC